MSRTATIDSVPAVDPAFAQAFRRGELTQDQAKAFASQDPAVIAFQLLELAGLMAAKRLPHTPSGSLAPYEKSLPKGKRRKKPGAREGHEGHSRDKPDRIDRTVEHSLPQCPECHGELTRTGRKRTRIIEDIPAGLKSEVTEHTIHRDWCPRCKKQVEPKVPDAMPACTLGNQAVALSTYLHYGIGTTTSQIVDVFNSHLQLKISEGGLTEIWHRVAKALKPWYEQIWKCCLDSAVLNADETGWHRNGVLIWLWCFCTDRETYYAFDDSRGHAALDKFFVEAFNGTLVTDFWRAYDAVETRMNQKCWAHLLRELKAVEERPHGIRDDWLDFAKRLRRIYTDAVRLAARPDLPEGSSSTEFVNDQGETIQYVTQAERDAKVCRLHKRLTDLACEDWTHPDAARLAKRLLKDCDSMLIFAEFPEVPATNNHGEREIRPLVLMRKASYGSASEKGSETRAILMTILRTLRVRGLNPQDELHSALNTLSKTGQLPPLPG